MKFNPAMRLRYIVLLNISVLSACNDDMSDLKSFVADIQIHASGNIEAMPEPHHYQSFSYPKQNKDPFNGSALQPKVVKPIQGVQINPNHKPEFLENFSIESMKMVGIIQHSQRTWGLIRSSDGMVHRVKKGDYVGTNHGKITHILPTEIRLLELIPNETGAYSPRNNFIHLEKQYSNAIKSTINTSNPSESKEKAIEQSLSR